MTNSLSSVDNVEHIWVTDLPPGRYDLQVLKKGGNSPERISETETYALAFEFGPPWTARLVNDSFVHEEFRARLEGEPYCTYVIEETVDFDTWLPVLTNAAGSDGFFDFTNAIGNAAGRHFYRSKWMP